MWDSSSWRSQIEILEARRLFSTYFVDAAAGNDRNTGRAAGTPWQTLSAVNAHAFHRGDKVLLTGTFSGQSLVLGSNATGITINSYSFNPVTRATKVGVANAAVLTDLPGDGVDIRTSNVTVENLTLTAAAGSVGSGAYSYGIYLVNSGAVELSHETINHVSASGFSYSGLCMQGWNTSASDSAGFSNVLIENSTFRDNQVSGIFVAAGNSTGNEYQPEFPGNLYIHKDLTIRNCQTYDNAGFNPALNGIADGNQVNSGNSTCGGIFISSVNRALVENCTAYNNCFASNGGVGIWAFDATRVVFQNDESDDNKTATLLDGDGFDFDHGVTHSVMQRDYSHGNDGVGLLITSNGGASNNSGDTIRYCVSDADGQVGGCGMEVLGSTVPVANANLYNNTILAGSASGLLRSPIGILGESSPDASVNVFNNILYTNGGGVIATDSVPSAGVRFEGNDYWRSGYPDNLSIQWGQTIYPTLSEWAGGTGVETVNGSIVGHHQDPVLANEAVGDLPRTNLANLALTPRSALQLEALNLAVSRNAPYRLPAAVSKGIGKFTLFNHPINRRALGAG